MNIKNKIFLAERCAMDGFIRHRKDLIILWVLAIIGAVIGGILAGFIKKTEFQGCIIIKCISGDYSPYGEIFTYIILFCFGTCISGCVIFNKIFIIFPYAISFFYGIKLGQNIAIAIIFNKIIGFFSILIFVLPIYTAMIILNSMFYIHLKYNICSCGKFACGCFCIKPILIYMLKMLLFLSAILIALLLILTTILKVIFAVV